MAIELIIGFTLLVIPDVVIRALIAADGGTTSTIVGRVLGGALIGLGIAGASARGHSPPHRALTKAALGGCILSGFRGWERRRLGRGEGVLIDPAMRDNKPLANTSTRGDWTGGLSACDS